MNPPALWPTRPVKVPADAKWKFDLSDIDSEIMFLLVPFFSIVNILMVGSGVITYAYIIYGIDTQREFQTLFRSRWFLNSRLSHFMETRTRLCISFEDYMQISVHNFFKRFSDPT
jgi:hypothetical protein